MHALITCFLLSMSSPHVSPYAVLTTCFPSCMSSRMFPSSMSSPHVSPHACPHTCFLHACPHHMFPLMHVFTACFPHACPHHMFPLMHVLTTSIPSCMSSRMFPLMHVLKHDFHPQWPGFSCPSVSDGLAIIRWRSSFSLASRANFGPFIMGPAINWGPLNTGPNMCFTSRGQTRGKFV
jgi:hypothetical protein